MESTNGVSRQRVIGDPFERALSIGGQTLPTGVIIGAVILAVMLHAGAAAGAVQAAVLHAFGAWANGVRGAVAAKLSQTYDVDVVKPTEPPPPPPKEEEPEKPVVKDIPKDQEPPPALAAAAKILAADPSPSDPPGAVDFTQGDAGTYSGGETASNGTSQKAVYNPLAVATGVPGGTGTAPVQTAAKADLSRAASLRNKAALSACPFPAEAEAEQISESHVIVEVKVAANGSVQSVVVPQDPGHGFGRQARKCAQTATYDPALDVNGKPMEGTARIRFHFTQR